MDKITDIVTDKELHAAWGNADFGEGKPRSIIARNLLKCACGFSTGSTAMAIAKELELVTSKWELTPKGKAYLYAAYSGGGVP